MNRAELTSTLIKQNPELGKCVDKWFPKVESVVKELSKITCQDSDDVLQDILLDLWIGVEWYGTPRVRYKKYLWEVSSKTDNQLVIERVFRSSDSFSQFPLRISDKDRELGRVIQEVVHPSVVEIPTQTSLSSFIYRGLWQFFLNTLARHFSQKNGYFQVGKENRRMKNRWNKQIKEVTVPIFEYKGEVLVMENEEEYSVFDYTTSPWNDPEHQLQESQLVSSVLNRLDGDAKKLFLFLMGEDEEYLEEISKRHQELLSERKPYAQFGRGMTFTDSTLRAYMGKSQKDIELLKREIVEVLPSHFSRFEEVRSALPSYVNDEEDVRA